MRSARPAREQVRFRWPVLMGRPGLVLLEEADSVAMVTEQARTVEQYRVGLVAVLERLDPGGDR